MYKKLMLSIFVLAFTISTVQSQSTPVSVIFDTDIGPDYDDVGALTLLHAFADKGEANILATISCNTFETTVPTLSVINTYFNRPNIPVGVTPGSFPDKDCSQEWAQYIVKKYPHTLKSNNQAEDAVNLYRKILAGQPDKSVTIVTVGFFTNLANLLYSGADNYSSLNGKDLVAKKVKHLVSMAASLGKDRKGGHEFNVAVDAQSSIKVFNEWPTPMIISGFEIGDVIYTGIPLISNNSIKESPVKDAFKVALEKDKNTIGRNSWDQTAVLVAVRGMEPYFGSRKLNLEILEDGKSMLAPGEKFTYLTFKQTPEEIAKVIEQLMAHQPVKH